jgi:N-acetylmuramoyl-L-alanine amidase
MKKNYLIAAMFLSLSALSVLMPRNCFAVSYLNDSITAQQLRSKYDTAKYGGNKVKILIVPGHDKSNWGTQYKDLREADLNYQSASELYKILSAQKEFEVIMVRDELNYSAEIAAYLSSKKEEIKNFISEHRVAMDTMLFASVIKSNDNVYHNQANSETINTLYGINKWSNENEIDLVVHLHSNDTPRKSYSVPGEYNGFVVYVPDNQFSNGKASIAIGGAIFNQISKYFGISNMPKESGGVVEDQKLIALGALNTLKPAAVLIEYGYIYESQVIRSWLRPVYIKEMATQTALGIKNFFESSDETDLATFPYKWTSDFKKGAKGYRDVFALQLALTTEGLYPPKGKTKNDCPINGNYGGCTSTAVASFQKSFGLKQNGAYVGKSTRAKLNALYYNKN